MRPHFSAKFVRSYQTAPATVQRAFDKQLRFLLLNMRHPSLHAKKYDENNNLWQARVNKGWRFYFQIRGGTYELHDITEHPK